ILATATPLGTIDSGSGTGTLLSIDGATDTDYYRLSVTAPKRVTVTLQPTGSTYLSGSDGPNAPPPAPFNSLAQNDLALAVVASDGTVLASANANGAGVAETLANV